MLVERQEEIAFLSVRGEAAHPQNAVLIYFSTYIWTKLWQDVLESGSIFLPTQPIKHKIQR
jgi:hypothetical protein